jgi:hypothetical protein
VSYFDIACLIVSSIVGDAEWRRQLGVANADNTVHNGQVEAL